MFRNCSKISSSSNAVWIDPQRFDHCHPIPQTSSLRCAISGFCCCKCGRAAYNQACSQRGIDFECASVPGIETYVIAPNQAITRPPRLPAHQFIQSNGLCCSQRIFFSCSITVPWQIHNKRWRQKQFSRGLSSNTECLGKQCDSRYAFDGLCSINSLQYLSLCKNTRLNWEV